MEIVSGTLAMVRQRIRELEALREQRQREIVDQNRFSQNNLAAMFEQSAVRNSQV